MEEQKTRQQSVIYDPSSGETIPSFLIKTYEILENDKFFDIISWTKNGEGFIVKKVKDFSETVLPIFFRHSNYTSFVRQLNMYDFHKTRQENHENAFKNLMFKRGYKHLLKDIQRKDYKKNKENGKEAVGERTLAEKARELPRNVEADPAQDYSRSSLTKVLELNSQIEKKALLLAEVRNVPTGQWDVLKLIDALFDANKLQAEMLRKMEALETVVESEGRERECAQGRQEGRREQGKMQCASTEAKTSQFDTLKDVRMTTHSTLFSSFRQA